MLDLNKVIISGNLTRDPKLRHTPKGVAVTDLLVALNREFSSQDGTQHEVCFVDVVVWGKQAELCVERLECSSTVLVEGRLHLDTWNSKEGDKRSKLRIVGERVHFLDGKKRSTLDVETLSKLSAQAGNKNDLVTQEES